MSSQFKDGKFKVIRIAISGGSKAITDNCSISNWLLAVEWFAICLKNEKDGCTWQIICPDGQIGAEAQF